ncbi:RING-type domain-containing protein [Aphelenchoides bicaudatus]|nr:RING-type domain-containing protein [Aphelenchoides bicaudatus]
MGNCLPFLYFNNQADDEEHLDQVHWNTLNDYSSHLQNNQRRHRQSQGNDRSNTSGNESTGATSAARRIRSHVSSYVNQLYTSSHDYQEERDREAIDEKRKARARAIVDNLRIAEYDGNDSDEECAICMLDFERGQLIRFLPCNHSYHNHCIDDWLLRSLTCPSCMEPVDSALLAAFTSSSGIKDVSKIPSKSSPPAGLS